jgi:hypothetical protein
MTLQDGATDHENKVDVFISRFHSRSGLMFTTCLHLLFEEVADFL